MRLSLVATALAVALSTMPLLAQSRLETNSGRVYVGQVLSDDGQRVEIETTGGATLKLPYEQLTLRTRYRLRKDRAADDGQGQLELAEWCVDQILYIEARRHYRAALEAADAVLTGTIDESLAAARTRASQELLERAQRLSQEGKPGEARRLLGAIVQELPLEAAAQEASRLLAAESEERKDSILGNEKSSAEESSAAPSEGERTQRALRTSGEPFSKDAYLIMAPVIQAYRRLVDRTQAGLQASASRGGKSITAYKSGLDEGDKALVSMGKIRSQDGRGVESEQEINEALKLAEARLEEAIVDCRLHLADAYLLRSSYRQADDVVKQGLVRYPRNEHLRRATERVSAANEHKDGGGWLVNRRSEGR